MPRPRKPVSTAGTRETAVIGHATKIYAWKARHLKLASFPADALMNFAFMYPEAEGAERLSITQNGQIVFDETPPHGCASLDEECLTLTFNARGWTDAMKTIRFKDKAGSRPTTFISGPLTPECRTVFLTIDLKLSIFRSTLPFCQGEWPAEG